MIEKKGVAPYADFSSERFFKAFYACPTALCIRRLSDGLFTDVNNSFLKIFGCLPEDIIGKTDIQLGILFRPEEEWEAESQAVERLFLMSGEFYHERKDGRRICLFCSGEVIELSHGEYIISTLTDITGEKQIDESIFRLNDLLEQRVQSKTKELTDALEREKEINILKSRFVSMALHEFNTPLSTILSSLYLLRQYSGTAEMNIHEKHIQRIERSVKKVQEILNGFLTEEKFEQGLIQVSLTEFNLHDLLGRITGELENTLKTGQKIFCRYTGMKYILLDPQILENILRELLSNAIKYSPEYATVECAFSVKDGLLSLCVSDHGIGIPEADQKFLFTGFFRAGNSENIEGTGMGLHQVKAYVELLQGRISFVSSPGKGSTFFLVLPLRNE